MSVKAGARFPVRLALAVLAAALVLIPFTRIAAAEESCTVLPALADAEALGCLMVARNSLAEYPLQTTDLERRIRLSSAIEALTALDQLYGCEWARPVLEEVRGYPDCPALIIGFSRDGRVMLRVEELELQNPAFTGDLVCLCTLESRSALNLGGDTAAALGLTLADGTVLEALPVDEAHPRWEQLENLAGSFHPPAQLLSGAGMSFKQYFLISVSFESISAVSLVWGDYGIIQPNYLYQEGL